MPTGGVDATEESIKAWFGAGVAAVGIDAKIETFEWTSFLQNVNEGLLEFRISPRWVLMAVFGDAAIGGVDALWTYRY